MTLQQDLDYYIEEHKQDSPLAKSWAAVNFLGRFDVIQEVINEETDKRYGEHLWSHTIRGSNPKSLREIVENYIEDRLSKNDALKIVKKMKTQAESYLRDKGYSADLVEEEQEKLLREVEERDNRRMKSLLQEFVRISEQAKNKLGTLPNGWLKSLEKTKKRIDEL